MSEPSRNARQTRAVTQITVRVKRVVRRARCLPAGSPIPTAEVTWGACPAGRDRPGGLDAPSGTLLPFLGYSRASGEREGRDRHAMGSIRTDLLLLQWIR